MTKLLYVSDSFVDSTVFESQVHTICNEHTANFDVTLLALCNASEVKKEGLKDRKYTLVKYKKPPKLFIPFMQKIAMLTFKEIELFKRADVIHCRGHIGAAFAMNVCKKHNFTKPIIADIRGAIPEEIKLTGGVGSSIMAYWALKLEKFVFENAGYFFFVSKNMRDFYYNRYLYDKKISSIFPTVVNEDFFFKSQTLRQEIRSKLNIDDMFVYIYVGGVHKLQNIDKILIAFDKERKKNSKLYLIMIVSDMAVVRKLIKEIDIKEENIYINSLPYNLVGQYINAADAGLIIREENIVNYVASPTKVNEYLACGLNVVDKIDYIGQMKYSMANAKYMSMDEIIKGQDEIYGKLFKGNI